MSSTAPTASETAAPAVASPMKVRKRNGSFEPVDVNKIVRAVGRSCTGLTPGRSAARGHAHHQRPLRRRHHARARPALDPDRGRAHRGGARVLAPGRAPPDDLHRQGSRGPGDPLVLAVDRGRAAARPDRRAARGLRGRERAQAERGGRAGAQRPASSTSASARSTTATCCATRRRARRSRPRSTSSCASPAACPRASRRRSSSTGMFSRPRVPAELADALQLGHAPRAALVVLPARLAAGRPARRSTTATPTWPCSRSSRAASASRSTACARAGSLIRGTNGHSNGIVPWLRTLDASVAAVNQGGKRKGACCVYLETWHADLEEFLELRDNTGDEARRTHNLNLAHWVPDLFMRRVEQDGTWSLFDPKAVPHLHRPLRRRRSTPPTRRRRRTGSRRSR